MNVVYIWLLAGVFFMIAEAVGVAGVGLMFAGLGALVTGGLISFGILSPDGTVAQFIIFFIATAAWAALLWKPMQKFRVGKPNNAYSNIVGETAYVGSGGIRKKTGGEVTWSGTIMSAELIKDAAVDTLEAGSAVIIVDVSGATLIVKPKE